MDLCARWLSDHFNLVLESFPSLSLLALITVPSTKMVCFASSRHVLQILNLGSRYKVTDESDHFYALWGHHGLQELASNIPADYEVSAKVLHKKFVHWAVSHGRNLDVLSYAQRQDHLGDECASWAPQWHKLSICSPLIGKANTNSSASSTSRPVYSFLNLVKLHSFFIDGFCFHTVSKV